MEKSIIFDNVKHYITKVYLVRTMKNTNTELPNHHKILLILDTQFVHWKGTQRFLFEMGSYLTKHGYEVTLLENANSELPDKPVKMDVNIPFKIVSLRFRKIFGVYVVPKSFIMSEKPDIIYATNLNSLPFIPSAGFKTIFGCLVLNISSLPYLQKSEKIKFRLKSYIFVTIQRFLWRNHQIMIHALNEDQGDWVRKITKNRYPVRVIGIPVEYPYMDIGTRIAQKAKNDKFTILYFGAFSNYRGFKEFIDIIKFIETKEINEDIIFLIAGDGPLKSQVVEVATSYDNVKFIERPSDNEKWKIMLNSDLFIYPSVIENFSIIAAEAQICGLPSLVADILPLKNIVINGKTGHVLALNNIEKMAYDKIYEYMQLWMDNYEKYKEMRIEISVLSKRLCKEEVLPKLLDMIQYFVQNDLVVCSPK